VKNTIPVPEPTIYFYYSYSNKTIDVISGEYFIPQAIAKLVQVFKSKIKTVEKDVPTNTY
jgi:hypothetical protein